MIRLFQCAALRKATNAVRVLGRCCLITARRWAYATCAATVRHTSPYRTAMPSHYEHSSAPERYFSPRGTAYGSSGTSAGFWLGGQCPLAAWDEEHFENLTIRNGAFWSIGLKKICGPHSAVLYTCLPWLLSKYNINLKKLLFFACFRFLIFHPFSRGVSWPHLPLCADAHAYDPFLRLFAPLRQKHWRSNSIRSLPSLR